MALTLKEAITATQTTIDVNGLDTLTNGDMYSLDDEYVLINTASPRAIQPGETAYQRVSLDRGVLGTRKAAHTAGTTLTAVNIASGPGGEGAGVLEDPGVGWQASHVYEVGDLFAETVDGALRVFEITGAGTSGTGVFSDYGPFDLAPNGEWGTNSETFLYRGVVGFLPWTIVPALAGGLVIGDVQGAGRELSYTSNAATDGEDLFALRATVASVPVPVFEANTAGDADWFLDENQGASFRFNVAADGVGVNPIKAVQMSTDGFKVFTFSESFEVEFDPFVVRVVGLPTADPVSAGSLWVDVAGGRVLKVSAG